VSRHLPQSVVMVGALMGLVVACGGDPTSSDREGSAPLRIAALPTDPPLCPLAEEGTVLARTITSAATGGVEHLRIYVPPGFERAAPASVPLLVLLHGGTADETQWIDVGIASAADCLIASGAIHPLMVVTVDGSRVETATDGREPPMERFVADEVLPYLHAGYPGLGGREVTSIGGISRGGAWALRIAADRPELFSAAGGHSPTTTITQEQLRSLAAHQVRLWLDVGDRDQLRPRVQRLAASIRSIGYGAMLMGWDGGHDRRYWSHHVEDYLRFYGKAW
jgi:enterochelin esterase-like enzyme